MAAARYLAVAALIAALPLAGRAEEAPPELPSLAATVDRVVAAVVSVTATGAVTAGEDLSDPFFAPFFNTPAGTLEFSFESSASGVIVDADKGYILTNSHIIENAERIVVTFAGDLAVDAEVVGADPATDLAVLRVTPPSTGLTELTLGDSDSLRVGDYVLAVGSPFGLSQSVTMGIVSGLGRSGLGIQGFEDFIQTDASINPGNSGGALVDLSGELVGINSAIIGLSGGNVGVGFAIPINLAHKVMLQLIAHGGIRRGELGLLMQNLTPELAASMGLAGSEGVIVSDVLADSAAGRAGVGIGDIIVRANGAAVADIASLHAVLGLLEAGAMVDLDVIGRHGARAVRVRLAQIIADEVVVDDDASLLDGVMLAPPGGPSAFRALLRGALVVAVKPDTPAALSDLQPGDLILDISGRTITSPGDAIEAARQAGPLPLQLVRGGRSQFLALGRTGP